MLILWTIYLYFLFQFNFSFRSYNSSLVFLEQEAAYDQHKPTYSTQQTCIQLYTISGKIHFNFDSRIEIKIRYYFTRLCTILTCDFRIDWVWHTGLREKGFPVLLWVMSTNNKCKKTIGKVDKAAVEASRELSAKKAPIKMLEEQNRDYESIMMDLLHQKLSNMRRGRS